MAKLKAKQRKKLKKSQFGLPEERKYPVDTENRAANAKARATQMVSKGVLSEASKEKIDAKADKVLGKKGKEKSKKGQSKKNKFLEMIGKKK